MSFGTILYNLLIYPLQLFFETLYGIAYRLIGNYGLAIIALSLAVNIIVFPLYRRADAMQKEERDIQEKMSRWVKHIRQTFKGDERYMMLQAYYRENHYNSFMVLRGSVSLLLQIPFFTAAYRFLHNYQAIRGISFGPIADLGAPDGLLQIAGLSINLLPILMTLINIVSGAIYTRGMPVKSKVQLYGMALVFLVLLYRSPAGLVFYWTLNNLFSLVKNIFYKLKHPRKVLAVLLSIVGILGLVVAFARYPEHVASLKRKAFVVIAALALQIPAVQLAIQRRKKAAGQPADAVGKTPDPTAKRGQWPSFLLSGLVLALLIGMLIPSALVADSPLEFVNAQFKANPNLDVFRATLIALGLFVVWFGIYYGLFDRKKKQVLAFCVWAAGIICAVNYMAFGRSLGNISSELFFDESPVFSMREKLVNLLVIAVILIVAYLIWKKGFKLTGVVSLALLVGVVGLSARNLLTTHRAYTAYARTREAQEELLRIPLSRTEKNVVVLMMDRAISYYYPYLLNEKPILREQFAGFTWYPNTLSYGIATIYASPCLFGGYEYTPQKINERSEDTLETKQNEAIRLMPELFYNEGYEVTVCDPPYAGYRWISDLSIYDEYPGMHTYHSIGTFVDKLPAVREQSAYIRRRNLFCYSVMKAAPVVMQPTLYEDGGYFGNRSDVFSYFANSYATLVAFPEITEAEDLGHGTFTMIVNDTTHEPCRLQRPDYEPVVKLDGKGYEEYEENIHDTRMGDLRELSLDNEEKQTHWDCNMAAMLRLGEWLDYLRAEDVYDNTRIIIVADHGKAVAPYEDSVFQNMADGKSLDPTGFRPLLLVKDFDSESSETDESYMTNADVPSIALAGIVDDPVNPFTGQPVNTDAKAYSENRRVILSPRWKPQKGSDTQLDTEGARWFEVGDDMNRADNWVPIANDEVTP